MHRRTLELLIAVMVQGEAIHAQPAGANSTASDSIDRYVADAMARQHIPGLSLAVLRAGKLIKAQGYGFADLEHGIPVTPQTVFKIGSVSKQFLATGIMLLAQDGRLKIDDPVARYFAETPDSWRDITLRHFLTHTSGVLREGPVYDSWKIQPDSVVVRSAFARPLEFPTGTKYQYCNTCYFALADVIARVSGKPWDAFLAERVFRPLGMKDTRTTTTTALVPRRARGYDWRDSGYVNAADYLALRPSGAFLSTVLDLARWDAALYGDQVLSRASRTAMWSRARLAGGDSSNYGFGWQLGTIDGRPRVHHGGSLPGFRSQYTRFVDDSLSVIVLTNGDDARADQIAVDVARIYRTTLFGPR